MNILDTIIAHKREEVALRKKEVSVKELQLMPLYKRASISLCDSIRDETKTGIIAEFKRRSPSKGLINGHSRIEVVAQGYYENGASAISVLTDEKFFGGTLQDIVAIRHLPIPILRKEFIIDEYQIVEAKAFGADVILLIAACLPPLRILQLASFAKKTGLEVLLEIHDQSELQHVCDGVDAVGINNRNLKDFAVDLEHSIQLGSKLPNGKLKIAESGIDSAETVKHLRAKGFDGFLIGEHFMKNQQPEKAFGAFASLLSEKLQNHAG